VQLSTNRLLTTIFWTTWTTTDTASNGQATASKKNKTPPRAKKMKFYGYPHLAHLLLAATAQANPKPKAKEPNLAHALLATVQLLTITLETDLTSSILPICQSSKHPSKLTKSQ
jgi:hypothetical protein